MATTTTIIPPSPDAAAAVPTPRAAPPGPDVLDAVETALVRHRAFGDSTYIRDQLAVAYRRRLHKLGSALPEAASLARLLDAITDCP